MIRASFVPPWVAMSESAIPKTWAEARDLVLANAPWIFLLATAERALEWHLIEAGIAGLLCFVSLAAGIYWRVFEGLAKPKGRRRLAFIFISIGAVALAIGIYLLAMQTTPSREQSAATGAESHSYAGDYHLSDAEIRGLRDRIFAIKDSLPEQISIEAADDAGARNVADGVSRALGFAGVHRGKVGTDYPITPQETGISIRVQDLSKIPSGAKKLADAIRGATGSEPRFTARPTSGASMEGFYVFVGTNPKEN